MYQAKGLSEMALKRYESAYDNFYKAARLGLRVSIPWLTGHAGPISRLLLDELIPLARRGLDIMDIDRADSDDCLGIIEARVGSGRNGAGWQRAFVEKNGMDMEALTAAYLSLQKQGLPVHEWPV